MRSLLLLTLACASLVGCGQTGNLYLPDKETEVVAPTSADAATEAERKRNEATRLPAPQ